MEDRIKYETDGPMLRVIMPSNLNTLSKLVIAGMFFLTFCVFVGLGLVSMSITVEISNWQNFSLEKKIK